MVSALLWSAQGRTALPYEMRFEMEQDPPLHQEPSGDRPSPAKMVGRGVLAGLAGTVVMTAFQKLVEMPLTGRDDSNAPAEFAEKVLSIPPGSARSRKRLTYATHFALGTLWGAAYGVAAHKGLRGQQAVAAVFATVYTGDVALNTVLGLYEPSSWSGREWAIDIVDKLVQAQATGIIFDHLLAPPDRPSLTADG